MAYYKCGSIHPTQNSNVVVDTASGAVANFQTPLAMPLLKTGFDFKATQEAGTPTPQSPKAITGVSAVSVIHTKENLVDIRPFNEFEITSSYSVLMNCVPNAKIRASLIDKDTSIDLTGISFGFVDSKWDKTTALTTKQYRWMVQMGVPATDKSNTSVFDTSIILTGLIFYPKTEETYNKVMARYNIEFEVQTVSEYHAYSGSTTLINLGGTYYGGYVTQDKEGHRQFELTHKLLDWLNTNFGYSNNAGRWNSYLFYGNISDKVDGGSMISEVFSQSNQGLDIIDNNCFRGSNSNKYIYIRCDDYTDPDDFKIAMQNTKLVYKLEEPIIISLPDGQPIKSLPGINNIFCDTGDTSLQFRKIG